MNARNGKIARLPRDVREELNQRLEQSQQSPQLLAWLNALSEVKKVLRDDFDGAPISKQNLSQWRQGGFQEWLARQELWAAVLDTEDFTQKFNDDRDNVFVDDVATVLAARFAALITHWNGEVDEKFEARTRVLNRICRSVVQLQRSMHRAKKDNEESLRELEEEHQKLMEKLKKRKLDQIWAIQQEPAVAELFGGGELGRKLAKYVVAVENDMPGAKLEMTDEDLKRAERVKAAKTRQTDKGTGKTEPEEVSKALEENEMEDANEEESGSLEPARHSRHGDGGSEQVRVSQTSLASADPSTAAASATPGTIPLCPLSPMSPITPIPQKEPEPC